MPKLLRFALGERNQLSNHVERHQLSKHAYRWAVEVPGEVPRQSARLLSPLPTVAAMPSIPAGKPVTVPSTARSESQAAYLPIRPSRWRSRVASSFSPPRGPLSRERPVRRGRPAPYLSRDGTLVHLAPFATPHMGLFGATAWGVFGVAPLRFRRSDRRREDNRRKLAEGDEYPGCPHRAKYCHNGGRGHSA